MKVKFNKWRKWCFSWTFENRKKVLKILIEKVPKWTAPPYHPMQIKLEPEEQIQETKKEENNGKNS